MLIRVEREQKKVFFSDFYQGDKRMTKEEILELINELSKIAESGE